MRLSVWCEFLPYPDLIALLPELAVRGLWLNLAVQAERRDDPALFELLRAARSHGVTLRAWLLLDKADGYWPNAWNAAIVADAARRLLDAADRHGAPLEWLIFDFEPPPDLALRLAGFASEGRWWSLLGALRSARRENRVLRPEIVYQAIFDELRRAGVRRQIVTMPMSLDEPFGPRLSGALGIDCLTLLADEFSVMAYRPEFARMAGPLTADIVGSYARTTVKLYGDTAGIAIGEIGSPGYPVPVPGYSDPADFQADLAACRAAGIASVSVFSLDGILEQGGLERWFDAPPVEAPGRDWRAARLRLTLAAATLLLPK
jgi:hypothetical protein